MSANWNISIKQFEGYLQLEKSLSPNSVEAYSRDIGKLRQYLDISKLPASPAQVTRASCATSWPGSASWA